MDKSTLRIELKRKRKEQLAFSSSMSTQIINKLYTHPKYQSATKVGIYVSHYGEVETISFIKEALKEKEVYVPKVVGEEMVMVQIHSINELQPGYFNILEPQNAIDADSLDLMITPLLGFDQSLYRLGYGKGYYDKYFSSHPYMYKIGLAYSYQKVETVYPDTYDIQLDEVLTEAS